MITKKEAAWQGRLAQFTSLMNYTRKSQISDSLEACLKTVIVWFPTYGLTPIVVADWLIRFFRLEAS